MTFTRTTGGQISLQEAKQLTHDFQTNHPDENKCYFMGASHIQTILNQQGCVGVRIYKGLNKDTDKKTLVLIGVDEDGKDMTDGFIADRMKTCPDQCYEGSDLML